MCLHGRPHAQHNGGAFSFVAVLVCVCLPFCRVCRRHGIDVGGLLKRDHMIITHQQNVINNHCNVSKGCFVVECTAEVGSDGDKCNKTYETWDGTRLRCPMRCPMTNEARRNGSSYQITCGMYKA